MKMVVQLLVPSMQHGNEADDSAKAVFRIPAEGEQGRGYGSEQDCQDDALVAQDGPDGAYTVFDNPRDAPL